MFIERKLNPQTEIIELWECEWDYAGASTAKKNYTKKVGEEQPYNPNGHDSWNKVKAICWANERTIGNIAVFSKEVLGQFPGREGNNAILPCEFVNAGKFRHGADRWWCRTHQTHWGTKADQTAYSKIGTMRCSNHSQPLNYTREPFELNPEDYAEVGIWCSLPPALSSKPIERRPPKIHLHLREKPQAKAKKVDRDYGAISLLYHQDQGLFRNPEISRVNITPPAAWEFVLALEEERDMSCINCTKCGYPHLDLGKFAKEPHRKHFCGNCGSDSIWSKQPIVSTPLKPLYDQLAKSTKFIQVDRILNMDDYPNCEYTIWASTPAVLWTAERPQEKGIHVHLSEDGRRIIDDTFGVVTLKGKRLMRNSLLQKMYKNIIT